jgi:PPOX class probable F420-dependent enzyme
MPERTAEPEPERRSDSERSPELAGEPGHGPGRRAFLRQLSNDAVLTAGKLAGASAVVRRSLVAAGESAIGSLEAAAEPAEPPAAAPTESVTADPLQPAEVTPAAPAGPNRAVPDPVAGLTAEQQAFLRDGATATLAVNDPGGHPLLASTTYHWDGAVVRLPARDFTARTANVDRDPRVSLLIEEQASGRWVAVSGTATLIYGDLVEPEMRRILAKYHGPEESARRWEGLRASGDQLVIVVRPTRFVWRPTRP